MFSKFTNLLYVALVATFFATSVTIYAGNVKPVSSVGKAIVAMPIVENCFYENSEQIADGLVYTELGVSTNEDRQHLYIIEVDLTKYSFYTSTYHSVNSEGKGAILNLQAMNVENTGKEVYAGVNGDFFTGSPVRPMGICYSNGKAITSSYSKGHNVALYSLKNGETYIGSADEALKNEGQLDNAISGFGRLIDNGNVIYNFNEMGSLGMATHPRTAVGLSKDRKTLIILVTDGRRVDAFYSKGISLPSEAQILYNLGCYNAINLDGGGSSTIIKRSILPDGSLEFKTLNNPSDGKERPVVNGLLIIKTDETSRPIRCNQ